MSSNKVAGITDKSRPLKPIYDDFEFRTVSWNTDNSYRNLDKDKKVVDFVLDEVKGYKANVICLQELDVHTYYLLAKELEALHQGWRTFFHYFGLLGSTICIRGPPSDKFFNAKKLSGERFGSSVDWWGYMQIRYRNALITNIHTRATWADTHVNQLHKEVANGIIAGDFNHESPETPGWIQTDRKRQFTWSPNPDPGEPRVYKKIDHILAIDKIQKVGGGARPKGGSNHRLVVASIVFSTGKKPIPNPWKNEPVPKKPWIKKAGIKKAGIKKAGIKKAGIKKAGIKKAGIKKAGIKKAAVKKKDPKKIVSRKILKRITR